MRFRKRILTEGEELESCSSLKVAVEYLRAKENEPKLTLKEFIKRPPQEILDVGRLARLMVFLGIWVAIARDIWDKEEDSNPL